MFKKVLIAIEARLRQNNKGVQRAWNTLRRRLFHCRPERSSCADSRRGGVYRACRYKGQLSEYEGYYSGM